MCTREITKKEGLSFIRNINGEVVSASQPEYFDNSDWKKNISSVEFSNPAENNREKAIVIFKLKNDEFVEWEQF